MSAGDEVTIETPEQIELALEPAGPGSRFVGWAVDFLIKSAVVILLLCCLLVVVAGLTSQHADESLLTAYVGAIVSVVIFLLAMTYDIYFEVMHNGQTPGKRVAGTRVIREGGAPVDFRSAFLRSMLAMVDVVPILPPYVIGGTVVLINGRRQRLGDMAAGTLVIRERADVPLASLSDEIRQLASDTIHFGPEHVSACTPRDRHILRSFFQRYPQMDRGARADLARRLAESMLERTAFPLEEPLRNGRQATAFLAALYRDLENWIQAGK